MNPLRILTFGWELAPILSGGLGVVCRDLTDALVKKGHKVTFVVPKLPEHLEGQGFALINASNYDLPENVTSLIRMDAKLAPYASVIKNTNTINPKFKYDNELYGVNLLDEVERYAYTASLVAKDVPHDIIHAHDWMTGIAALRAKEVSGKPVFFHVHSTEYDRTANNPNPLILDYEKLALDGADQIIAISAYTKKIVVEKYHINPNKIAIVHNAIDTSDMNPEEALSEDRAKMVLFLARLTIQKGADYLLKAAQKVLSKKKNVKFVFVGKGPMLNRLVDMAFELGISENVVFAGSMDHTQVDHAYRQASLFVMPSVSEPFGLTCLEAIKNGTPVLISKQSGASEVIKNALKVDFWNVDEMASKILSVLDNDSLAETLSQNGFYDLKKLTWDTQADKVVEIYLNLLRAYKK